MKTLKRQSLLSRRPLRIFLSLLIALLLSGCLGSSYPKETLAESVKKLCKKEYGFEPDVKLVGKTLYVACELEGLIGQDLGLQRKSLEKLEGAMLSVTRGALSSDAKIEFLVVRARDSKIKMLVSLIRYLEDVKSLLYMRISRNDFSDRLILEYRSEPEPEDPNKWYDIPVTEFMSRLSASRLQRRFTANPLVNVFLQVHEVKGLYEQGVISFHLDKFEKAEGTNVLVNEILETSVIEVLTDIIRKYDGNKAQIKSVTVFDRNHVKLLDLKRQELFEKEKAIKKAKKSA